MSPLSELQTFLANEQILMSAADRDHYGRDWTTYFDIKASGVLLPKSTEEVQKIVLWARKHNLKLVPSGGRTGLSGGAVAAQGEWVISFEKMNRIKHFDPVDSAVVVEAGVVTETLQKFALEQGLQYPVDFAARGSSHIGGNIATNAGGIKVVRYGLTRDWVSGLTVVTGGGEVLQLNQGLIKNNTGYDLRHLFIGSEGTLGFITEAVIRLTQPAPPTKVLFLAAQSLQAIMPVYQIFRNQLQLTAFEMLSDLALTRVCAHTGLARPFATTSPFYLVVEVECASEASEAGLLAAFEQCLEQELLVDGLISSSEEQAKNFWRYREDISECLAAFSPYKNDLAVRISQVPKLVESLDQVLRNNYPDWEVVWFGHIGDGNLHINILRPANLTKEAFVQACQKVDSQVFAVVQDCGGSISAEHGVGLTKKPFLAFSRTPAEIQIFRDLKKVFDPDGILNPGKIFDY